MPKLMHPVWGVPFFAWGSNSYHAYPNIVILSNGSGVGKCIISMVLFHYAVRRLHERGTARVGHSHQTKFRSMVLTVSCSKNSSPSFISLSDSLRTKVLGVEVSS